MELSCHGPVLDEEVLIYLEWILAVLGGIIFIIVSKVTTFLQKLEDKTWYKDFITFLIAMSMSTMFCMTVFQLIPEGNTNINRP